MRNLLKKLKSQKGATGIDVVMASAMIMITIAVVSILYVNTSLQTRNIKRTAGATRLATNIAENIQALSYEEFISAYNGIATTEKYKEVDYRKVESVNSDRTIFSTKLPKGYAFYIKAEPVYGSHLDPKEQFDLVRDIDIIVTYKIGDSVDDISLSLTKQRELVEECNKPVLSYLSGTANKTIYPVKYVETTGSYMKTNEDDMDWYDYTNKKWAVVFVSDKKENEVFDANGKYTGVELRKYVWIPAYFVEGSGNDFYAFRYNFSNKMIEKSSLTSLPDGEGKTSTFNYYTFSTHPVSQQGVDGIDGAGLWVEITDTFLQEIQPARVLNNSIYGPFIVHK